MFAIAICGRPVNASPGSPRRIHARWIKALRSSPAYHWARRSRLPSFGKVMVLLAEGATASRDVALRQAQAPNGSLQKESRTPARFCAGSNSAVVEFVEDGNQEPPHVSRAALTSEASRKVCSCASVASASKAAMARTLATRPYSSRRFPAGVAETKGYAFDPERQRFVESHREGHPRFQGLRRLVFKPSGYTPTVYAVCTR